MSMEVYAIFPPSRNVEGMLEEPIAFFADFYKAELQASRLSMKDGQRYLIAKYTVKEEVDAPLVKRVTVSGTLVVDEGGNTKNFAMRLLSCKEYDGENEMFEVDTIGSNNYLNHTFFRYRYTIDVGENDTLDTIKAAAQARAEADSRNLARKA